MEGQFMSYEGYVPPTDDGRTITAPDDHPYGVYRAGDHVDPFNMINAHLRIAATYRTPSGRISAEAKRAQNELNRRRTNRPLKKTHKRAVREAALAAAGL